MGDALCGKAADDAACLPGHAEATEKERHVDVRLVALIVKLFAEELLQLCGQLLLADELYHSRQVHRCAPAVLPAGALIKSVATHLGVGLVDVPELFGPDTVEDGFSAFLPEQSVFLQAEFICQLTEGPEVAACFEALVWTLQAEPLHLLHHAGICFAKRGDADALPIGVEQRGNGMFRANRRHTFVVGAPVLLACDVKLRERLHDVARVTFVEKRDERELCAIGVPKRP